MQTFSVLMGWNTGAFSTDHLRYLLFAFVVFTVYLFTSFASTLEGETKTQEDCYLALAGGPSSKHTIRELIKYMLKYYNLYGIFVDYIQEYVFGIVPQTSRTRDRA